MKKNQRRRRLYPERGPLGLAPDKVSRLNSYLPSRELAELASEFGDLFEGFGDEEDLLGGVVIDAELADRVDAKRAFFHGGIDRAKQVLDAAIIARAKDLQFAVFAQQSIFDRIPIK